MGVKKMRIRVSLHYDINHLINIKKEKKEYGFCSMMEDDILYYLLYHKKLSAHTINQEKFEIKLGLSINDFNHTGCGGYYILVVGKTQFFVLKTFHQGIYEMIDNPFYFDEKKVVTKSKKERKELTLIKQYLQLKHIYQEKVKLSYILLNGYIEKLDILNFDTQHLHPDVAPHFIKIKKIYKNILCFSQSKLNELNMCLEYIFSFIDSQKGSQKKTQKI